jgi:DNA-binding PadR family transcriptional regulator
MDQGSWERAEANREAKFYAITKAGLVAVRREAEKWRRLSQAFGEP